MSCNRLYILDVLLPPHCDMMVCRVLQLLRMHVLLGRDASFRRCCLRACAPLLPTLSAMRALCCISQQADYPRDLVGALCCYVHVQLLLGWVLFDPRNRGAQP